jgi:hypothetical protein
MLKHRLSFVAVALIATAAHAQLPPAKPPGAKPPAVAAGKVKAIFYVSPEGKDTNAGTLEAPFKTIQQAVTLAGQGSTIIVRGGTYRETVTTPRSGTAAAPITILNYKGEDVVVSGADPIAGEWTLVENEVYRAEMPWNYHFENEKAEYDSNQVFHKGKMLELARWPDQTSSDPVRPTIALADSVTFSKSTPDAKGNDLATFHEADFKDNPERWIGAKIWVNLARNGLDGQGQTGTVISAEEGKITVKDIDSRGGNGAWGIGEGTEFYLFQPTAESLNKAGGIAAGIDKGEWFIDAENKHIYVRTATGEKPEPGSIEAKQRTYGFNFDGDSHLVLRGIGLFATSLTTDDLAPNRNTNPGGVAAASNIVIDGMKAYYVSHFNDHTGNYQMQWQQKSGLILSGTNIVFKNGEIRYSAGSGLSMFGKNGKVLNSVFQDLNLGASEAGMVNFGKTYDPGNGVVVSDDHEFAYNTLFNSPQQGVNFRALKNSTKSPKDTRARIHHNLIHDVMLRSHDSGAIDSLGTHHAFVRIDHNIIYNVQGQRGYGIYFDFAAGGVVDHNVVYNVTRPININWDTKRGAQDMWILNNVGISDKPKQAGLDTGARGSDKSIIHNNIWSNGMWIGGWNGGLNVPLEGAKVSDNIVATDELFVDSVNPDMAVRNYQLKETAVEAINKGIRVPPYDDKLIGQPDLGAYEFGVAPWAVGAGKMPAGK